MLIVEGSKALALMITVALGPVGTVFVICGAGEVSFRPVGTDTHPQIKAKEINTSTRIVYFFMKERMDVFLIILFP
jgi:hypothetical protein